MTQWNLVTVGWCLAAVLLWLGADGARGAAERAYGGDGDGPQLMLRPQRPSQFRHEGEVKAYLQRLREWVEDSMRNNARFGKRSEGPTSGSTNTGYHNRPTQWNAYQAYARNNI